MLQLNRTSELIIILNCTEWGLERSGESAAELGLDPQLLMRNLLLFLDVVPPQLCCLRRQEEWDDPGLIEKSLKPQDKLSQMAYKIGKNNQLQNVN